MSLKNSLNRQEKMLKNYDKYQEIWFKNLVKSQVERSKTKKQKEEEKQNPGGTQNSIDSPMKSISTERKGMNESFF